MTGGAWRARGRQSTKARFMESKCVSVLFVCHGNICRSPMAQCVMQQIVDERGLSDHVVVDSAATTNEEIGNPLYPPARRKLQAEGVPLVEHRARRIRADEAAKWDYIVCMDEENLRHLRRIAGADGMARVSKLMSWAGDARDVADPWYTGDFDATYDDVVAGCAGLVAQVECDLGLG